MDILIYSVEQQKCAFFSLQTSLLQIVLLYNCTCTLQRSKDRDPEWTTVCVVLVKLCNLSPP